MKRFFYAVVFASASLFFFNDARAQAFLRGDNILGVGVGVGSSLGFNHGSEGLGLALHYEHGHWDVGGPGVISLGGYLGYKSFSYDAPLYREKLSYTMIGFRSAYHYNGLDVKELDIYGGLMLSVNISNYTISDPNYRIYTRDYPSTLGLSLYLGGRYFLSQKVAAFAEFGYGISFLTLGAAFRL